VKTAAEEIIDRLGGLTKVATLLNCPISTVQGWKERGKIPQERWVPIIEAAAPAITLTPTDFLFAPTPPVSETTPAAERAA
jgi:hypothetical protein